MGRGVSGKDPGHASTGSDGGDAGDVSVAGGSHGDMFLSEILNSDNLKSPQNEFVT